MGFSVFFYIVKNFYIFIVNWINIISSRIFY
jgi:hypothetical protein